MLSRESREQNNREYLNDIQQRNEENQFKFLIRLNADERSEGEKKPNTHI